MTAVFTDFYRTQLFGSLDTVAPIDPNQNLMQTGKSVHWTFFRYHAAFTGPNDTRYTSIRTVSDLLGLRGWSAPLTPNSSTQPVGATTPATTTYCLANNPFTMGGGWTTSTVTAAALVLEGSYGGVTDPIIYLTDTPFGGDTVLGPNDTLLARPVSAIGGNRPLFTWPMYTPPAAGQPPVTTVVPTEGSVAVVKAAPPYEISYMQHCWMYPQRVNMIANPSFEAVPGTNHWRTNGTFTRVTGTPTVPSAPGGGAAYGHFAGSAPVVAESNAFPTTIYPEVTSLWTIQAMVRGTGKLRVGLVGWDDTFLTTQSDWGDDGNGKPESWTIPAAGFLHVYARRHSYEDTTAMVRFESDGGTFDLDNVLCEPDWLTDWPYFDGDSTYGARGDFSWYGGTNRKGQSYSLWYNHRRATTGRLFAWDIDDNDFTITDEEVEAQGFVYKWVPAGVRITPHLDVLWPGDIQEAVPNNAGTPITAYDNGTNGGVTNPWV